jgi:vitamin B12 transporter
MLSRSCLSAARLRALTPYVRFIACFLESPFFLSPPARADDVAEEPLAQIVVGATRLPTPESELGGSVTVITSEEIAARQQRTLPDALLLVPGLNVTQTGGPGGLASVFIRGTNSNQSKIFVDGIDVSDPSSPNGAFDYAHLLTFDLDRVEVLRGPQSGLYGADAIGGVINIMTEKGEGPGRAITRAEIGSFAAFNQSARILGSAEAFSYAFGFAHFHVGDTPATPPDLVPPGRNLNADSYDNRTASMRLGAALSDQFDVGATSRYIETTLYSTSDDFIGPESLRSRSDSRQLFSRAFAHLTLFDGRFDQTLGLAYTNYDRTYLDPNSTPLAPSLYGGGRAKLDWQGNLRLLEGEVLTFGGEREEDRVDNGGASSFFARNGVTAGFAQLQSSIGGRLFNALSFRYDANDQFGGAATYRIAPALLFPETGTKLKGSLGTGFKAPSLDELYNNYPAYHFFGNPDLRPETSIGFDGGVEQVLSPNRITMGATYFANKLTNLIDFNETFTSYVNIARARTFGLETFLTLSPWDGFSVRADYTYTVAKNETTQLDLLRRPRDKLSLTATLQATPSLLLSATLVSVGPWKDVNRAGSLTNLPASGYTLVNLAGAYDFGRGASAFARIDNLFNCRYQNPLGFQRPGLGVFGGVKIAFGPEGLP